MIKLLDDFRYYNANSRDKDVGDCVKRSLSLAYNIDYNKVGSELRKIRRDGNYSAWNIPQVFERFINRHGLIDTEQYKNSDNYTVEDYSNSHKDGIYLVRCGSKSSSRSSHIVCIIDGTIYDSWDSRNWIIYKVYIISRDYTNVNNVSNSTHLADYAMDTIKKQVADYNLGYGELIMDDDPLFNKYDFYICCEYDISKNNKDVLPSDTKTIFELNFMYKFSPRNSTEQNKSIIDNITKNYVKKYLSNITKYIKDVKDNEELNSQYDDKFIGSTEEKVIRDKLPYWCRKLIISIDDYGPNSYRDRYQVLMQALKDDPKLKLGNHSDEYNIVYFSNDSLRDLINDINQYKYTYERQDYDY